MLTDAGCFVKLAAHGSEDLEKEFSAKNAESDGKLVCAPLFCTSSAPISYPFVQHVYKVHRKKVVTP